MAKYFCNCCGKHFESDLPELDVYCPECGVYDIYSDTAEGAAQSIKDITAYENKQIAWEN